MPHFTKPAAYCRALLAAAALGVCASAGAQGLDLSLNVGHATTNGVYKYGVLGGYTQPEPLWQFGSFDVRLRHELELALWKVPDARNLIEFGYSPFLRLERPFQGADSRVFVEASIGVRLLSHKHLSPTKTLSTNFQFSDQLGAGFEWGQATVGVRFQHLSNAGIKKPNPGINFTNVYFRYRF